MIHSIYRLSDNGYPKDKFAYATKQHCLLNFLKHFGHLGNIHLLVDETNLTDETREFAMALGNRVNLEFYAGGSSAASFRFAWNTMKSLPDDAIVYFVEDDYLHRAKSDIVLLEGIERADMVSLYDHFDKYLPASMGGNKFIGDDASEQTRVALTNTCHWKLTNSTTMTFAARKATLLDDEDTWEKYTMGTHPNDFLAFIELRHKGKSLITPIPGYATHCEPKWAAPLIDWEKE